MNSNMRNAYRYLPILCSISVMASIMAEPNRPVAKVSRNYSRNVSNNDSQIKTLERTFLDTVRQNKMLRSKKGRHFRKEKHSLSSSEELVIGDVRAPVSIIIYFSPFCPFCADFFLNEFYKLAEYVKKRRLKIYPKLYINDEADFEASMLISCLTRGSVVKFMDFINFTIKNREVMRSKGANKKELVDFILSSVTSKYPITINEIEACQTDTATYEKLIAEQMQTINEIEIDILPTFVIETPHGTRVHKGKISAGDLLQKCQ